jgi:hypothetical protein
MNILYVATHPNRTMGWLRPPLSIWGGCDHLDGIEGGVRGGQTPLENYEVIFSLFYKF